MDPDQGRDWQEVPQEGFMDEPHGIFMEEKNVLARSIGETCGGIAICGARAYGDYG